MSETAFFPKWKIGFASQILEARECDLFSTSGEFAAERTKSYHTKLCKRLCGQICAKLRTSLFSAESSVLIVAEFSAASWQRNFALRKEQPKIRLSEKTDIPSFGAMCPVLARSMRRRGAQRVIGQKCPKPPSGGEVAKRAIL